VSGFGKTDGRADDGRSRGLTGQTGGRWTDARTRGGRAEESGGGPETDREREKREREGREGGQRDRSVAAQEISWRIAHTSHQPHRHLKREERGRVRVRRFLCGTECCGSDGEERGAPAQILSKEGSVAS
jgi:hypothetical protein